MHPLTHPLPVTAHVSLLDKNSLTPARASVNGTTRTSDQDFERRKLPLRQPDARMTRYFRLFSQFTIILARMPAMTGAAKSCQKAMPSSANVI